MRKLINVALSAMKSEGADKAQCSISRNASEEINIEGNHISLKRTVFNNTASLTAIKDNKKGSISLNQLNEAEILEAAKNAYSIAVSSQSDEANDIALKEEGQESFASGLEAADNEKLYQRLQEFLDTLKSKAPTVFAEGMVCFSKSEVFIGNTNDVYLTEQKGQYVFQFMFSAKEGEKTSSFNYSYSMSKDFNKPLWELGGLGMLVMQSVDELKAKNLKDKFVGDIIISPPCLDDFLNMYNSSFLGEYSLVAGTSVLKDKLGQKVAGDNVTIKSEPLDTSLCGYNITGEGYRAKNITIIEKGVLKSFLLSQYGAKKTGNERSGNMGDMCHLEPGTIPHEELIAGVKRGLLVCRFSGGAPSDNGDFSGVAKNSFYIEDGKIAFPVTETMISGNLLDLLNNVVDISSDVIDFGNCRHPWARIIGVGISGS